MSMLSIDCFEQRSLRLLRHKLQALQQLNQRVCNACNKLRKSQCNVLINYEVLWVYDQDIVYVCSKCIQSKHILKNQPTMLLKSMISVLTILTQKDIRSQSRDLVRGVIDNIGAMHHMRKYKRDELAELVADSLDGFDQQYQQYTLQYQNLSIKACDQIREFYQDICGSKITTYYGLTGESTLSFDSKFQQYLRDYVQKQITYKLQVLQDMRTLTKQVREVDHLFNSVKKMLKSLEEYGWGFEKTKELQQKVVYSISRTAIQHKHVEGYYETKQLAIKSKVKQMVRMETCFGAAPVIFKITITSLMEYVELGICLAKKTASYQKVVRAFLIRLEVRSDEFLAEQIASKKQVERQNISRKSKMMGVSQCQDKSWELSAERSSIESEDCLFQISSRQSKSRLQEFQILSGDEISLFYDNATDRLTIQNLSTNLALLSKDLSRMGKMAVYPCVRLVSYNCKVERIVEQ